MPLKLNLIIDYGQKKFREAQEHQPKLKNVELKQCKVI